MRITLNGVEILFWKYSNNFKIILNKACIISQIRFSVRYTNEFDAKMFVMAKRKFIRFKKKQEFTEMPSQEESTLNLVVHKLYESQKATL